MRAYYCSIYSQIYWTTNFFIPLNFSELHPEDNIDLGFVYKPFNESKANYKSPAIYFTLWLSVMIRERTGLKPHPEKLLKNIVAMEANIDLNALNPDAHLYMDKIKTQFYESVAGEIRPYQNK